MVFLLVPKKRACVQPRINKSVNNLPDFRERKHEGYTVTISESLNLPRDREGIPITNMRTRLQILEPKVWFPQESLCTHETPAGWEDLGGQRILVWLSGLSSGPWTIFKLLLKISHSLLLQEVQLPRDSQSVYNGADPPKSDLNLPFLLK